MFGSSIQNSYFGFLCIECILKKSWGVWLGFWQMQNAFYLKCILQIFISRVKVKIHIFLDYDFNFWFWFLLKQMRPIKRSINTPTTITFAPFPIVLSGFFFFFLLDLCVPPFFWRKKNLQQKKFSIKLKIFPLTFKLQMDKV